ncbi:MAG: G-D-S-L family lipolytic protein [Maribacter sp.]|nr:G-D-S-L family lipolytic protein [Maribacter sp.]
MRYLVAILLFIAVTGRSQDPNRFKDEVRNIQKKYDTLWDSSKETIVFTGSSSVRIWKDLESISPGHQIVNSGFGGSQASDLLAFSEELILRFNPNKVFIYEGDNDISASKKPKDIIHTIEEIIKKIRAQNNTVQIVLIAAKPSISRWHLKRNYKRLNRKFKKLSKKDNRIKFADVWKPMLHNRHVMQDIFIEDGLHMNAKGYNIWRATIKPFIN